MMEQEEVQLTSDIVHRLLFLFLISISITFWYLCIRAQLGHTIYVLILHAADSPVIIFMLHVEFDILIEVIHTHFMNEG